MAQKTKNPSFRVLIDRFTDELTAAIASHVEEQVAAALSHLRVKAARSDGRRSGRICPVPGCGKPGAGPRNRWFCKEHSRRLSASEQKGILERNRRLLAEGKAPAVVPAQRVVRLPARTPRPRRSLDMSCRVEGCPNRSRGPRAGYICDQHRAELSSEQQEAARKAWNARRKGQALPASEQPKAPPSAVPPIVRKAEPAEA